MGTSAMGSSHYAKVTVTGRSKEATVTYQGTVEGHYCERGTDCSTCLESVTYKSTTRRQTPPYEGCNDCTFYQGLAKYGSKWHMQVYLENAWCFITCDPLQGEDGPLIGIDHFPQNGNWVPLKYSKHSNVQVTVQEVPNPNKK